MFGRLEKSVGAAFKLTRTGLLITQRRISNARIRIRVARVHRSLVGRAMVALGFRGVIISVEPYEW